MNIEARDLQTDIPLVHILGSPQLMINCLAIIQHHDGAHDPDSNGCVPPHDTRLHFGHLVPGPDLRHFTVLYDHTVTFFFQKQMFTFSFWQNCP